MRNFLFSSAICLLLSGVLPAQNLGFKSYSSYEEYCFDNPKAPTCVNGKPMKMTDFNKGLAYKQPSVQTTPRQAQPVRPAEKPLQLRADWRFAHPQAELLGGIDVAALRQSQTVRDLLVRLAAEFQISPAELDKMLAQGSGIDQLWLSFRSGDSLVLLQGRLELPAGMVALPKGMTSYRISDSAVVLGRQASVVAAVQRLKRQTAAQPAAIAKIKELSAANQLWFIGTAALVKQAQSARTDTPQAGALPAAMMGAQSRLAHDLTGFSIGMSLRDGYQMDALLKFSSQAAARQLLASAGPGAPGASTLQEKQGAMKLTRGVEGSSVRVTLSVEHAELLRLMEKALASPAAQKLKDLAAAARKPSAITISGSGGGRPQQNGSSSVVTPTGSPSQTMNGITIQGGYSPNKH